MGQLMLEVEERGSLGRFQGKRPVRTNAPSLVDRSKGGLPLQVNTINLGGKLSRHVSPPQQELTAANARKRTKSMPLLLRGARPVVCKVIIPFRLPPHRSRFTRTNQIHDTLECSPAHNLGIFLALARLRLVSNRQLLQEKVKP